MERVSKENYYLDIAETVIGRATCLRRCYGAIIVPCSVWGSSRGMPSTLARIVRHRGLFAPPPQMRLERISTPWARAISTQSRMAKATPSSTAWVISPRLVSIRRPVNAPRAEGSLWGRLHESWETVGSLLPGIAAKLGLRTDTTVCAGAGDNAAAAVGCGVVGGGRCNISLGTSGTVFITSDTFGADRHNALHAFAHADGGFHLMGCILSAASCNKWWQEGRYTFRHSR